VRSMATSKEGAAGCAADALSMAPLSLEGEREAPLTKLFVSDLPATATSDGLRAALEPFGDLDEVVVKHTNGVYRQGAHFGFVWTSKEVALKIMSQTHVVDGQRIPAPVLAKRQQRLVGKEPKASVDPRCPPDKIFVGGLSNETKVTEFRVAATPHTPPVARRFLARLRAPPTRLGALRLTAHVSAMLPGPSNAPRL